MTHMISGDVVQQCKQKLLMLKQDLLNRVKSSQLEFSAQEKTSSGDEADQSVAQLAENHFLIAQDRLRRQLLEIEFALARIQLRTFGVCEETQEPIEVERLLALPYTRLSLEGAEIRESMERRYAR